MTNARDQKALELARQVVDGHRPLLPSIQVAILEGMAWVNPTIVPAESAPSGDTVAADPRDLIRVGRTCMKWIKSLGRGYPNDPSDVIVDLANEFDGAKARIAELEASIAQKRSKREKAAQDERDRLYAKAQASNTANFLRQEGAMMPHERAARAARGEQT